MKDVYILTWLADRNIICIADDIERCNMEMAKYTHVQQKLMIIQNYNLLEDGD